MAAQTPPSSPTSLDRRTALKAGGVATASAATVLLAATSGSRTARLAEVTSVPVALTGDTPGAAGRTASAPSAAGGTALGPASAVPVHGGRIYPDQRVVVTQPTAGTFRAFSATCTHRGCTVGSVSGGTINCPCHGSTFAITDGSVTHGPAERSLPARHVTVAAGVLYVS